MLSYKCILALIASVSLNQEFSAQEYFCSMLYSIEQDYITANLENYIKKIDLPKDSIKLSQVKKYNYLVLKKCIKEAGLLNEKQAIDKIQVLLNDTSQIGDLDKYVKIEDDVLQNLVFDDSVNIAEDEYIQKMLQKQIWNAEQKKTMSQMIKEQSEKITVAKTLRILIREQTFVVRVGVIILVLLVIIQIVVLIYCCVSSSVEQDFKLVIQELSEQLEKKQIIEEDDKIKNKKKKPRPFKNFKQIITKK